MNGSGPGETGVLAWCNSLRLNIAKDPGREFLEAQIQKQGFDFLESYREGVFSRQREDPVYELLKTPSRKKDAGKKTRSAAAVAAKVKAANAALQEEISVSKENVFPINDFHKALLEAKASGSQGNHHAETSSSQDTKKQHTKIVTIIDSPEAERMEIDDLRPPQSVPPLPDTTSLRHNIPADCEPRAHTAEVPSATAYTLQHDSSVPLPLGDALAHPTYEQSSSEPLELIADEDKGPAPESQSETGMVTVSGPEQLTAHGLVPKELSMIVEGDEPEEPSNSGFPGISPDDAGQDITVPLRDEPSSNTLKRKPSMTQFSGLPAPSPLRKSMRMSREPSVGQGLSTAFSLAHTPGAGLGSKRTSWLTKAKQAKASEVGGSGKRAVTPGGGFFGGHGIPSSASTEDMTEEYTGKHSGGLGLGFVFPQREVAETEDTTKWEPIKPTESTGSSLPKGKQKAASLDGDRVQAQAQRSEHPTSLPLPPPHSDMQPTPFHSENDPTVHTTSADSEDDVLDRLKKTVEDLGARTGKGVAKSLGGTAAAALAEMAEARAAAAVRVAQRNQQEGGVDVDTDAEAASIAPVNVVVETLTEDKAEEHASMSHPRLSLSELTIAPLTETQKPDNESDSGLKATDKMRTSHIGDDSTSTTPPNSPPVILTHAPPLPKPVFTKPSPVFTIPAQPAAKQASSKDLSSKLPTTNPFTLPPKTAKIPPAVPPLVTPFSFGPSTLSAQSSKASTLSDSIFDKEDSVPAWMAGTQDTEFSVPITRHSQELNEDDSWHMDEKFQSNQMWTPFGFTSSDKDDASTWSTFPGGSTSQRGEDTGSVMPTESLPVPQEKAGPIGLFGPEVDKADSEDVPERSVVNLNSDHDKPDENTEMDMDIDDTGESPDLDDLITSGKPTVTLVKQSKPETTRSHSQQSMASSSSSSSQTHLGILGQASRFVSSMLGASKKTKPEPVKSLALAAAAAKKQQEEAEKKALRLKEMENRRQLALQRKADEEKARAAEEERKAKEDAERRKREREEHTEKRALKGAKTEDDTTKKRKITVDVDKKPSQAKKPPSKDNQTSRSAKPGGSHAPPSTTKAGGAFKHVAKQPSVTSLASSVQKPSEAKPTPKPAASSSNLRAPASAKGKGKATDLDDVQPAQLVQSQMAHRAKAQIQAATPRQPPPVTSESIELPDINSEYSDSEDEDRPRTFDPPEWAQSPELRQALEQQSHMNPDDIFGRIGPLRMEEIFRTRQSRFRSRTSSANWSGPDQLTAEEEREYARRMGFK